MDPAPKVFDTTAGAIVIPLSKIAKTKRLAYAFLPSRWAIIYRRPSTGPHDLKGRQQARAPPRQKEPVFIATRSLSTVVGPPRPRGPGAMGGGSDFFFVLRRYEIVATTATTFWWFALQAADVTIIDAAGSPTLDPSHPEAVYIRLEGSEASQSGPPVVRML
ncbi:hypothetical protein PC110_g9989 [Phytophthora cactorum]|uniref:Uncharacterized protein n=1 Tax=Phytophthora cactorum TaxID=29920 RepID=A0A329SAJ2_9STRA|nr:hypothetical protein PC110_g9989 [Phytophthora cactorum]